MSDPAGERNPPPASGGRRRGAGPLALQLAGLLLVLFLVSMAIGPVGLSLGEVLSGFFGGGDDAAGIIVREIRLPRTLLAVLIGATLGVAGASLQGLLRSPLASPYLLGAPSAAAFAAVAAIAIGIVSATSSFLPVAAMTGALASVALLILVAGPRSSLLALILAGLAVSTLAAAGTALALTLAQERFSESEITFWLLGSLENRSLGHVWAALPFLAASWLLLAWDRPAFRALALGEEATQSLGINLQQVRLRVVIGIAVGVGGAVAVAGSIGFVGLVAPQLMRPFVGYDPGRLLLPAALSGASLLLIADIIVRLVPAAQEINIGVITALFGVPFLLYMIMRQRRVVAGTTP